MITFNEIQKKGYAARTAHNIMKCGVTIAFATDFKTKGELLTKKLCEQYKKPYIPVDFNNKELSDERVNRIANWFHTHDRSGVINIAGNGIYSLNETQDELNRFMESFFEKLEWCIGIDLIISGGQTGFDEAGIVAADWMGYDCEVNAPKGWCFRNKQGKDIYDEGLFKSRFIVNS